MVFKAESNETTKSVFPASLNLQMSKSSLERRDMILSAAWLTWAAASLFDTRGAYSSLSSIASSKQSTPDVEPSWRSSNETIILSSGVWTWGRRSSKGSTTGEPRLRSLSATNRGIEEPCSPCTAVLAISLITSNALSREAICSSGFCETSPRIKSSIFKSLVILILKTVLSMGTGQPAESRPEYYRSLVQE